MTFVVTENCIMCKHTTCVEVCPTDAFKEGANFLVIDPALCIDCDLCVPECPIDAIYEEGKLPDNQSHFLALNAELSLIWPEITKVKEPITDHELWDGVENKLALLEKNGH
jgi:ferredoxin